ncbi:MAG: pyruvate, phosphate dikinase [Caldivirga sp.]|jgi:pyruvate,orthophosphate dikinase
MARKYVLTFEEANPDDVKLLGGKATSLVLMTRLGLPVPPGFTITTAACREYYRNGEKLPEGLMDEVVEGIRYLEAKTGRKFGGEDNPLLVSVRSGAAVSMPGMMDTVLNVGLNDRTLQGFIRFIGSEHAAYDAYRRFLAMFGRIVLGIPEEEFNKPLEEIKRKYGVKEDPEIPLQGLKELVEIYKQVYLRRVGRIIDDPWEQLRLSIEAVFKSWNSPRARFYREANKITPDIADCTAASIVTMVFGNADWRSATGVVFSRNPATGEDELYGEYLPYAQGEDVVAGIRTPKPISELKKEMPEVYEQLYNGVKLIERTKKAVQDVEFTIEKGKLWFLQTRNAKMNPLAMIKVAVDMVKQGWMTKEEAVMTIKPQHILQVLYPRIDETKAPKPIAKGIAASPGAVSGQAVFDPDSAVEWAKAGKRVILVREETKPDDVHGFYASVGILTSRGGATSHAAVVARAIGRPAVVGAEGLKIDYSTKTARAGDVVIKEGDWITIDGFTGNVYVGQVPTIEPKLPPEFYELLDMADSVSVFGVKANADTPEDASIARRFGAKGIGLLRTERMFRAPGRLELFRSVILSTNADERRDALNKLAELMRRDFEEIFEIMEGYPVTVRLFDPPLHEFLPNIEELVADVTRARVLGRPDVEKESLLARVKALMEANPMMGHRGVRLGITFPDIYAAQVKAILEAALELKKRGKIVQVQIMIPQVSDYKELEYIINNVIKPTAEDVFKRYGDRVEFKVGTMMETVRACLTADKIAKVVDFMSFGTNDLTQAVFSFSRDDVENKFMSQYLSLGILPYDPFMTIDRDGVAKLMKIAVDLARSVKPNIEIGICGEHGGDADSIRILAEVVGRGLDYFSASPYRVPVARLVAAQESLKILGRAPKIAEY